MTPERAPGLDVFYPIAPDLAWLERLVPLGVRTVQLRLKDASSATVAREIAEAIDICKRHRCQLIVNDYWREALELGADFVHLGQEDLAGADVQAQDHVLVDQRLVETAVLGLGHPVGGKANLVEGLGLERANRQAGRKQQ